MLYLAVIVEGPLAVKKEVRILVADYAQFYHGLSERMFKPRFPIRSYQAIFACTKPVVS